MPIDFRDGKTFPRRGRDSLGDFLWLPRVFDKARAKASGMHDGYIYPCPMDRAVMQRWGISPPEFTAAIRENSTDDQILAWLSGRVSADRMRDANAWVLGQKNALDRHDAEEGVPGAVAPSSQWQYVVIALIMVATALIIKLINR